jgi:hypothetical protein
MKNVALAKVFAERASVPRLELEIRMTERSLTRARKVSEIRVLQRQKEIYEAELAARKVGRDSVELSPKPGGAR